MPKRNRDWDIVESGPPSSSPDDLDTVGSGTNGEGCVEILPTTCESEPESTTEDIVDAWYGEVLDDDKLKLLRDTIANHPDQLPVLLRFLPLPEGQQEVVIGKDDRRLVSPTTDFPWAPIMSLRIFAKDGSNFIGTGWLNGPRSVITAGHCVYMHSHGGWAERVEVIPGRDGSARPFGTQNATSFASVRGYTESKKNDFDYGQVKLATPFDYLEPFEFANLSSSQLKTTSNLSGYPGDLGNGAYQYHDSNRISKVDRRKIYYETDTAGGQSGSPVWLYYSSSGRRVVVGIHTTGSYYANSGTRINDEVEDLLRKWSST